MNKTVFNIIELQSDADFRQKDVTAFTVSNYGSSDLWLVFSTGVRILVPKYDPVNIHARSFDNQPSFFPYDIEFSVEFKNGRGRAIIIYNQSLTEKTC